LGDTPQAPGGERGQTKERHTRVLQDPPGGLLLHQQEWRTIIAKMCAERALANILFTILYWFSGEIPQLYLLLTAYDHTPAIITNAVLLHSRHISFNTIQNFHRRRPKWPSGN